LTLIDLFDVVCSHRVNAEGRLSSARVADSLETPHPLQLTSYLVCIYALNADAYYGVSYIKESGVGGLSCNLARHIA